MIKLKTVLPNPNNPRLVNDDKFKKLVQSIKDFPKMLALRPMIVDENGIVLGGNMRLKALKKLGYKEIPSEWVKRASELTEDEKRQFIIKDNVGFGEWDWDLLQAEWGVDELGEWGLDVVSNDFDNVDLDYSDKNKEIDLDEFSSNMILKLEYTEEDYNRVRDKLMELGATPEQAVYKLLFNE